jgi:hypothetical protein
MRPGWRRALRTPLILLGVNLVVAGLAVGVVYGYADSQESLRNRLAGAMRSLNYQRASVADDIAYLDANRAEYDALLERGLVSDQDRFAAAQLLEQLSRDHGLGGVRYSFSPQQTAPLGPGRLAQITLLTTEVTVDMSGLTDVDLLAFARAVADRFPCDVRITALDLECRQSVDRDLLTRIRAGERVALVEGRLQFDWRMVRPGEAAGDGPGTRPS